MTQTSFVAVFVLAFSQLSGSQQSTTTLQRDAHAADLLGQSLTAMGGTVPADSAASGSIAITAGGESAQGSITLLTRGTNQTSIQIQSSMASWTVIYSKGSANKVDGTGTTTLPLELTLSSQSAYFPMPFLASLLNNADISLQFIGQETLGSIMANHIRTWNTFTSNPSMQFLSDFSVTDIWLDASTALPLQISFTRRYGGGDAPKISATIAFSNYQPISGVRYASTIQEYLNGTLWATTTVQSIAFNTGLTDANFPVDQGIN